MSPAGDHPRAHPGVVTTCPPSPQFPSLSLADGSHGPRHLSAVQRSCGPAVCHPPRYSSSLDWLDAMCLPNPPSLMAAQSSQGPPPDLRSFLSNIHHPTTMSTIACCGRSGGHHVLTGEPLPDTSHLCTYIRYSRGCPPTHVMLPNSAIKRRT
nr:hypothetical protein CFP56_79226 [Quercus suber]